MKPLVRYLSMRGEVYQLRIPVPKDLHDRIRRKELRWSLETKHRRTAEYRTWKASVHFGDLCDFIRIMNDLSNDDVKALVLEFFGQLKASFKLTPAMADKDKVAYEIEQESLSEDAVAIWKDQLETSVFGQEIEQEVDSLLGTHGFKGVDLDTDQQLRLKHGVVRAKIEFQRYVAKMNLDPFAEYDPSDKLFKGHNFIEPMNPPIPMPAKNPDQKSIPNDPKQSIGYLAEKFLDRGEKVGYNKGKPWRDATIKLYRRAVPWFVELVGSETNIAEVNKEHVKSIRDILLLRPLGLSSKISVFKISKADEKDRASRTTTRNEFGAICKFLRWCENESYIDKAPINVEGIAKPVTIKTDKKQPFTPDQLNQLFSSSLFSGRKKKKLPHVAGPYIIKDELYWAMLLHLYTGGRTGCVASLFVEDVVLNHDIPYFKFRMRENNLKEESSERDTPIHPDLFEYGFEGFVASRMKTKPNDFLFGRLKGKQELRITLNKQLNRYRKRVILGENIGMHSFRHGMIAALRNAGCPESASKRIVGHADSSVHGGYGGDISLEAQLGFLIKAKIPLTEKTKDILRQPANV